MSSPSAHGEEDLAARAYRLLLDRPGLDIEQLAALLECNEQDVQTVLDRLTDLSLLQFRQTEYGSMVPVSPIVAMLQLISAEQLLLSQRHQFLGQSYDTFSSILAGYLTPPPADFLVGERLTDLAAVRRRLEELSLSAKQEVLSFSPTANNPTATRSASRPLDLANLRRGVAMRTLYHHTVSFEPAALAYAGELAREGAQIRLAPNLPIRLIIIDREIAMVPADPQDSTNGAIVVREQSLVQGLAALFEAYWTQSRPLPDKAAPQEECTLAERAVLQLLAKSAKDETVARELRTSVRTVRRIIADLMARAQVDSRFALGMYAATHHWI